MDTVLGSRTEIKIEDLSELKYTNCVFKETLRLWPPAGGVARETLPNFKINEYEIPNKTLIHVEKNDRYEILPLFEC